MLSSYCAESDVLTRQLYKDKCSNCDCFEKMFWQILSHMTNTKRQQLVHFATGSVALPASVDSTSRVPSVAITLNVIGPTGSVALPASVDSTSRVPSVAITLDVIGSRSTDSLPVCSQRIHQTCTVVLKK